MYQKKLSKSEKRILGIVLLIMDMIDYGIKNPNSDIGKLVWAGMK